MEYQIEEGDPLLRLRCSVIPNLNTGIYNSATNHTINYHHNTDGGGLITQMGGLITQMGGLITQMGRGLINNIRRKGKGASA